MLNCHHAKKILPSFRFCISSIPCTHVSGIGAVVKVVDSHLYGWGSIPGKSCSFFIVSRAYHCASCVLISVKNTGCLVGFPWLAVCYWITTLNNTYTHVPYEWSCLQLQLYTQKTAQFSLSINFVFVYTSRSIVYLHN